MKLSAVKSVLSALMFASLTLVGCATPPQKAAEAPLFYPEPPDAPRMQFLASYTGAKDIEGGKSAFDVFITGEKEKVRRLDKPYGVALQDGKIYVADTNETVMVFDLDKKTFAPLQGAQGLGKLTQPLNITTDKEGNKYVVDPIRGQVVVYDKKDFYVTAFGIAGGWKPVDAAVYEDMLYVADMKSSEIRVLDRKTGADIRRIGQKGDPTQRLVMPTNVAIDREGYIYVSDAGRFQIIKFDRDGHLIKTIGRLGTNLGHFSRPKGIAVDREGRLFVVDAAFDNVQVFDKEGRLLLFFGKGGRDRGDLYLPAKVSIDYENAKYFQQYVDPKFEVEYLLLVTNQFGDRMVNVFAFGKEKGRRYPSEEEALKELEERVKKFIKETPKTEETEKETK